MPVILAIFYRNLNFLDRSSNNPQISLYVKIHQVEAMLFHADMARNSSDQNVSNSC
jgi:hypothetical protein